jgi:hypothetical protein
MGITLTTIGPIRTTAITDRTRTMATLTGLHTIGTADIDTTATTAIIIGTITGITKAT